MVAYCFQQPFIEPIRGRTKTGTIRGPRSRHSPHARVGAELQLYYGLRTKHCLLIGTARCVRVAPIVLDFAGKAIFFPEALDTISEAVELHQFAIADGFTHWGALTRFWADRHPGVSQFEGFHIQWDDTFIDGRG